MTVDVVIPLFDKAPYVEQAVRSALAQSVPPHSVIVVDDASRDDGPARVLAIAAADPRVRLLASPTGTPRGAAAARNRGIAAGTGELVAFLDADDYWEPGKLEAQLPRLADPAIGTVHCGERQVDAAGRTLRELYPPAPLSGRALHDAVRLQRYGVTGSASAVLTRRALLDAAGPFPEGVAFGEDWDMWARLAGLSGLVAVPALLTNIRHLGTPSRARPPADRFLDWLRVFDRWQDDPRLMRMALADARGMLPRHQLGMLGDPHRSRAASLATYATMLPLIALRTGRRAIEEMTRMRPG